MVRYGLAKAEKGQWRYFSARGAIYLSDTHRWIVANFARQMRLKSTMIGMPLMVASFLSYAWTAGETVEIAGIIVSLFFCGFSLM